MEIPMQAAPFQTAKDALAFILAGNATITIRSEKTGQRFTYKIRKAKDGNIFFVSLMNGSDNESSFAYLGTIKNNHYQHGRKSTIGQDEPSNKAFDWSFKQLTHDNIPTALKVWHEGSCGRCGRKLTVPESIESGIGPECSKKVKSFACEEV
jgi:hypothetical protein